MPAGMCGRRLGPSHTRRHRLYRQLRTCRPLPRRRAGQKVLRVQGAMPREMDFKQTLCAANRQALEQLCRRITRPALGRRGRTDQRCRPNHVEAQDSLAQLHHAPGMSSLEFRERLATPVTRLHPAPCRLCSGRAMAATGLLTDELLRLHRVGLRRPSLWIHRQKAGVKSSMTVSRRSRGSHFDPERTSGVLISAPRSCRSESQPSWAPNQWAHIGRRH
jgi:hypothetical protein